MYITGNGGPENDHEPAVEAGGRLPPQELQAADMQQAVDVEQAVDAEQETDVERATDVEQAADAEQATE